MYLHTDRQAYSISVAATPMAVSKLPGLSEKFTKTSDQQVGASMLDVALIRCDGSMMTPA